MRPLAEFGVACTLVAGCAFDTEAIGRGLESDGQQDDGGSTSAVDDPPLTTTIGTTTPPSSTSTPSGGEDETNAVDSNPSASEASSATTSGRDGSSSVTTDPDDATATTDNTVGPTSSSETSAGEETASIEACPQTFTALAWAEDADVTLPMELVAATGANGDPMVALSDVQDAGTVVFSVDVPCPGTYSAWGLVWDYYPGALASNDPDSFYVSTDGAEVVWRYGCETVGETRGLSWQPLRELNSQPCNSVPIQVVVSAAGTVELHFRNREPGNGGSVVAGISAILLSNDASLDPYAEYTP